MLVCCKWSASVPSSRLPVAVLHHEVDRRWRVQHFVESDDVGVSHFLENLDLAADPLNVGDRLDAALLQNLSTFADTAWVRMNSACCGKLTMSMWLHFSETRQESTQGHISVRCNGSRCSKGLKQAPMSWVSSCRWRVSDDSYAAFLKVLSIEGARNMGQDLVPVPVERFALHRTRRAALLPVLLGGPKQSPHTRRGPYIQLTASAVVIDVALSVREWRTQMQTGDTRNDCTSQPGATHGTCYTLLLLLLRLVVVTDKHGMVCRNTSYTDSWYSMCSSSSSSSISSSLFPCCCSARLGWLLVA